LAPGCCPAALVIDEHGAAVAQLEHAGCNDFFARLHAGRHTDLVAPRSLDLHELLADAAIRLAVLPFHFSHDEDRITVRCVADSRRGQCDHGAAGSHHHFRLHEHAGPQPSLGIRQRRLHLDVARLGIHDRVDCRDPPVKFNAVSPLPSALVIRTSRPTRI
jgi:hypothetical protein